MFSENGSYYMKCVDLWTIVLIKGVLPVYFTSHFIVRLKCTIVYHLGQSKLMETIFYPFDEIHFLEIFRKISI